MPFGKYKSFEECCAANQDKKNPEGYCASIEKAITGKWPGQMVPAMVKKSLHKAINKGGK